MSQVKGLPSVQGAVLLFDGDCGTVRAVIDSRLVTHYKTAADSLLGAQCLARAGSRHLVVLGAGAVAGTLARAYDAAFPDIERISIWSRRPWQRARQAASPTIRSPSSRTAAAHLDLMMASYVVGAVNA
ncbi:hypothetical protein BBJ66_22300 [Rhizobium sp. RSm-3]|uniref:hypothetical protein n=1 Tax=unclassified Rhizobium TaxID=2613769 RepID=UPI0008DAFFB3|nr:MULTISPECIES: hypothetical protein [unclassified Rhizobium]OHV25371.1 hypothetical protein BBJ66_22300 [Rhizobium sp. RSm-3]